MIKAAMSQSTEILRTPLAATLDGFTRSAGDADGVDIRALDPLASLFVRTKNSTYQINRLDGAAAAAVVQGGRFFQTPTTVDACGATMGGSCIKFGWIGVGFCLEFIADGQRVITTRVRAIHIQRASDQWRPH
jgi:hypothetical protein